MKTLFKTVAVLSLFAALVGCKSAPKYVITDGEWALSAWVDDAGEEMVVTQNRATMKFGEDSKVNGNAGCNQFMGKYEVNGDKIKIDMGGMTMKMCMDMTIENRMVTQMPNISSFKIDGNHLILFNGEGKELFRFDNTVVPADNNNQ